LSLYFTLKGDTHEVHNSGINGWTISPHDDTCYVFQNQK
jgi:hypothetical protein